jgi:hypothetical protein
MTIPGDDLHVTAEKFLREYLLKTGSKSEAVQPSLATPTPARRVAEAQAAAKALIREHLKKRQRAKIDAERYESEEPKQMILFRRNPRCVSYFYGFKRGLPVFAHDKALAMFIDAADRNKLSRLLRERHGIETFILPAPEPRRSSL